MMGNATAIGAAIATIVVYLHDNPARGTVIPFRPQVRLEQMSYGSVCVRGELVGVKRILGMRTEGCLMFFVAEWPGGCSYHGSACLYREGGWYAGAGKTVRVWTGI